MGHEEVRKKACGFLRENEWVGGERWLEFVEVEDRGQRGKGEERRGSEGGSGDQERKARGYLRRMAKVGEWVDHLLVIATAHVLRRKIQIFSKEGVTTVEPEREEGEVLLGFVMEEHYFGVRREEVEEGEVVKEKEGERPVEEQVKQMLEKGDVQGEGEADGASRGKEQEVSAVFNLGVAGLTKAMEDLLSLGLKFVPVQKIDKSKVEADVERLKVRLMWSAFWRWKEDFPSGEEGVEEGSQDQGREEVGVWGQWNEEQRRKERRFEGKTTRMPTALPYRWKEAIGKYCEAVKEDIIRGIRRSPRDNLTMEARVALKGLQEKVKRKEWAVRPADKGRGVTVEPYEGWWRIGERS